MPKDGEHISDPEDNESGETKENENAFYSSRKSGTDRIRVACRCLMGCIFANEVGERLNSLNLGSGDTFDRDIYYLSATKLANIVKDWESSTYANGILEESENMWEIDRPEIGGYRGNAETLSKLFSRKVHFINMSSENGDEPSMDTRIAAFQWFLNPTNCWSDVGVVGVVGGGDG